MSNATPISDQHSRKQDMLAAINSRQHFSNQRPLAHYVARSWERCMVDYKLNPDRQREPLQVTRYELEQRRDQNSDFLAIAATEVSNLYQQISGLGSAILLADRDGVIMNVVGDSRFLDKTRREGFHEGFVWSEQSCGTNGLGTCLAERSPVLIHHHDHFFANYSQLTCAAAPIFDHTGELLGVLDASSDSPLAQQYSVALVKMSAQMIENRVFMSSCAPHYLIRFHSRLEFVGALGEGVIAFDTEGDVKAMNGTAQFQFDEDWETGVSKASIDDFFDTSIPQMLHLAHRHEHPVIQLRCARSGRRFYASVHAPREDSVGADLYIPKTSRSLTVDLDHRQKPQLAGACLQSALSLEHFEFGDADISEAIDIASRALSTNAAPVFIVGQTGTGKSSLAAALHRHCLGADRPFFRVNCAALNGENLEHQLFGGDGPLQGRGSLFLDEIHELAADLQPAFLHLLERFYDGDSNADQPYRQGLQIISASQCDLAQAVAEGRFRQDLYYRLCGVKVQLKPLAQRDDTVALIERLCQLHQDRPEPLDKQCIALLSSAQWPGNLRELLSVITRARLLAGEQTPQARHISQALAQQPEAQLNAQPTASNSTAGHEGLSLLELAERKTLQEALNESNWSVSDVAKTLGLSRNTIYRKMSKYALPAKRATPRAPTEH